MKVYVCYQCFHDFCNNWEIMEHIFADELKAMEWVSEFEEVKYQGSAVEWRSYEEVEVE